jgi:hypothetical protein
MSEVDGMVHVIAACPEGEEMVVTVQKSALKSTTPQPKAVEQQHTYKVMRETIDPYHCHDNLETVGTYDTLEAANKAARQNLTEEWGTDYFAEFKVEEVDGMVRVDAMCPDGESMTVRIKKKGVVAKKSAAQSLAVGAPGEITVYHVSRHTIDYHHDPEGGLQDTEIKGTFLSLAKANECARRDLLDEWDEDFFEEYEETVHDGMVTIKTNCPEGEEMNVYVEKGKLFTDGVQVEGLVELEEELEESEGESDY